MSNKVYWLIRCNHCGRYQACFVVAPRKYTFKCRSCNHSTKLWQESNKGIILQHELVREGAARAAERVQFLNTPKETT